MRALGFSVFLLGVTGLVVFLTSVAAPPNLAFRPGAPCSTPVAAQADTAGLLKKKPQTELVNRLWVDKVPKSPRDLTFHLVLLDKAKQRVAAAAHTSAWRFHVDRLRFSLAGDKLTLESPQDGAKATFTTRTFPCKGQAPEPYDFCLELKRGRNKVTLYSERAAHFGAEGELGLFGQGLADTEVPACEGCVDRAPRWFRDRAVSVD